MWEPLLEPWKFQASMARKLDTSVLNTSTVTEICVQSKMQLNLNFTESVLEVYIFLVGVLISSKFWFMLLDPVLVVMNHNYL